MIKRHQRQTASQEAGLVNKEAAIHLSNLLIADPKDGKPTRVRFEMQGDTKVRVAVKTGEKING